MSDEPEVTPELLLQAYTIGVFPMGDEGSDASLYWVDPHMRGIIPLDGLHVSRSLRKTILKGGYEVRVDYDFRGTMQDCAARDETWINDTILDLYGVLHARGFAHSVEVWRGNIRIGGLYGVSIGAAFFGESMFSTERDASKIALVYLIARLRSGGYNLLDTQFTTPHLISLGAREISRATYQKRLSEAIMKPANFAALDRGIEPDEMLRLAVEPE